MAHLDITVAGGRDMCITIEVRKHLECPLLQMQVVERKLDGDVLRAGLYLPFTFRFNNLDHGEYDVKIYGSNSMTCRGILLQSFIFQTSK